MVTREEANEKFKRAYAEAQNVIDLLNKYPTAASRLEAGKKFQSLSAQFSTMWADAAAISENQSYDYTPYAVDADNFFSSFKKLGDAIRREGQKAGSGGGGRPPTAGNGQTGEGGGSGRPPLISDPPLERPPATPPAVVQEGPPWGIIAGVALVLVGVGLLAFTRPPQGPIQGMRRRRRSMR
jgi:hypothetical protein